MGTPSLRTKLIADTDLGAGNVLAKLHEHGVSPDEPAITFDVDVDGHPAWTALTLGALSDRVAARAAWLRERGIGRRDPVAIYVTSAADCFLNYLALTWLGAIPALMNGNMPGDVAVEFVRRLRVVGAIVDDVHRPHLAGQDLAGQGSEPPLLFDAADMGGGDPAQAPPHYRHHADDPVAVTHSSGTTRMPTPVVHSHSSLFAAIRAIRLTEPRSHEPVRHMSALPAAHAAGIITLNQALCNRYELLCLSAQGGPFGNNGSAVLDAIERWRPTGVFGFAVTWAELAALDLAGRDLDSVRVWFNTGDCAHEAHVRRLIAVGSHPTWTSQGMVTVPGSRFTDGIGSTEMGHSAFQITHRQSTDRYDRCVGKPYAFAEVALLDLETGEQVPDGQVGHVGLKSPTLALGYWNDSVNTFRTRLGGYYLTGDLMYRDEQGYYYHVDRAVDAVELGGGEWLYTALAEERVLARCPDVRDCTVVARRVGDEVVTEVLLMLARGADPDVDRTGVVREAIGGAAGRTVRSAPVVNEDDIVLGPTGKVRKFLMRQRHLAAVGQSG
ncbi:class I adenylate-forming enzyme family protein [Luedemannella helvata]|uniref:AMP-binding protein n=1 Tax=Luedemannella helvata TaxID=349315 RepID=A0ABP4WWZ8_9ACTN